MHLTVAALILLGLEGSSVLHPTSLQRTDIHLWLSGRVNEKVCVSDKINGTMGHISLKYRVPEEEDVGVYTSHIRTDISERRSIALGFDVGMKVIVCGTLQKEPNIGSYYDPRPERTNYILKRATIVRDRRRD